MNGPLAAATSTLTPAETGRLPGLVAAVLADRLPVERLGWELDRLQEERLPALAAALFERLLYRIDTRNYGLYDRMWRVYAALGPARQDAAYFVAALAVQMAPIAPASGHMARGLFHMLHRQGRPEDAVDLFGHRLIESPEDPSVEPWEIQPVLRELGQSLPEYSRPVCAPDARRDHRAFAAETREPWSCNAVGGLVPRGLAAFATRRWERPAIDVAELRDAEVQISRNTVVVTDRNGVLHPDLSVAAYPDDVRRKLERTEAEGEPIPVHDADEALVISDYCPPPNLCHFLYDQLTRLAVYQRVGVDTARALVIGPPFRDNFRQPVLQRAGVTRLLSTDQRVRVRARRLWVSSNCRVVSHFAHFGAGWAIEFMRQTLGGRGVKGWRRLFLSRRDVAPRRMLVNEAEVIALLEPHGFEVIVPGTTPYEAQIAAFRQASHVVAPHGAALAHLVLCPPEAQILEIFHPLYTDHAYAMQVQAGGINYTAMVARDAYSDAAEWNDPDPARDIWAYQTRDMRVDLDRLARYLATVV